jgi:hypothetical protein
MRLVSNMLAMSVKSLIVWYCLLATLCEYSWPDELWHLVHHQKSFPDGLLRDVLSDDDSRGRLCHYVIWQLRGLKSLCIIANP